MKGKEQLIFMEVVLIFKLFYNLEIIESIMLLAFFFFTNQENLLYWTYFTKQVLQGEYADG